MNESLATVHGRELLANTLEERLDRCRVADKGRRHLEATGRNVTLSSSDVSGNPLDKVCRVLLLNGSELVLDVLHGDLSTVDAHDGKVAAVAGVRSSHHVLGVKHLLSELRNRYSAVRGRATRGERSKADHEEVETGEGHHVDGELTEIRVELTGEAETCGDTRHDDRNKVVEVTVGRGRELESTEADVVESFVVDTEGLVRVLNKLVDGEGGVVGLDNSVGDLGGRDDGEGAHHAVGVLLTDLGDEECTHTGTGTTTEGVGDLETLEGVTAFGLTTDNVEDRVDELGTLSVVTLGPVVSGTALTKDEVVRAEEASQRSTTDRVHCSRLQVNQDGAGNVFASSCLIVVDIDALELNVGRALVGTVGLNAVLFGDDLPDVSLGAVWCCLPELGTDLVTTLAGLKVDNLAH